MSKMIFILQQKAGTSREECLARWAGEHHTSIVGRLPGLTRWVQNHVVSAPGDQAACDGVRELSFESDDSLQAALGLAGDGGRCRGRPELPRYGADRLGDR